MKLCYSEPHECIQDFDDCECDEQAIEYHSNIDKPCAAVDTEVKSNKLNVSQSQVIESVINLIDSAIFLGSEADHLLHDEEATQFNVFGKLVKLLDL
jgi:hypothetical protein